MSIRCFLMIFIGTVIGIGFMSLIPAGHNLTSTDKMVAEAMKESSIMTVHELEELMTGFDTYTLIDVRQEIEHYYGFIPGSVVLPRGIIEFNIENLDFWEHEGLYMPEKDEIIVVYCHKGQRGALAAHTLQHMGFNKVYYLEGGFKKWELSYPDLVDKNLEALGGGPKEKAPSGC